MSLKVEKMPEYLLKIAKKNGIRGCITTCKYCGRESEPEYYLNISGPIEEVIEYLNKKRDDFSANCICQKSKI